MATLLIKESKELDREEEEGVDALLTLDDHTFGYQQRSDRSVAKERALTSSHEGVAVVGRSD